MELLRTAIHYIYKDTKGPYGRGYPQLHAHQFSPVIFEEVELDIYS